MSKSFYCDAAGYPTFPGSSKRDKPYSPDDLNELQALFDDCLQECNFSRDSVTAEALGRAIIRLYSEGQHDPLVVKGLLLPSFKRRC